MPDFAHGLRISRGDRLIDVIHIWSYRLSLEEDPDLLIACLEDILPELLRLLQDDQTDIGLRGVIAEALAVFSVTIEARSAALRRAQDSRLARLTELRTIIIDGLQQCLDYKTAVSGLVAIAKALSALTMTPDVQTLAQRVRAIPSPAVHRNLPPHLRSQPGTHKAAEP